MQTRDNAAFVRRYKVHGEIYCGAHRLPAGKTAARELQRGRPASQAKNLIEDRLLLLSKAIAPFVITAEF